MVFTVKLFWCVVMLLGCLTYSEICCLTLFIVQSIFNAMFSICLRFLCRTVGA
jgi:hypothetical protein